MKEKIKIFLETDLLEKYLLETTTYEENLRVERYISLYPEVRKMYHLLEDNLKEFAELYAVSTPVENKSKIIRNVKAIKFKETSRFRKYVVAASIIAFLFAGTSYLFWNKNQDLMQKNDVVNRQIRLMEENFNDKLADLRNQFILKNNPHTKKYKFRGNERNKNLKAVALVNPIKKLSYLSIDQLPEIPEDKSLQMWVNVNGEMKSLGLLHTTEQDKFLAIPYEEGAISYHITLEPKGGNIVASEENTIAKISLK